MLTRHFMVLKRKIFQVEVRDGDKKDSFLDGTEEIRKAAHFLRF